MVPWQTEDQDNTRPQLGSLDMNSKQVDVRETAGSKRLLSSEKYNLIKERLSAGGGPAASSSTSVGGQTRSSSSGGQFQSIRDVVLPPPGHPFLKTRPSMQSCPPFILPPPTHSLPPPSHSLPPPSHSQPPTFHTQPLPSYHQPPPSHTQLPAFHTQPPPLSQNALNKSRPTASYQLSGLMTTPTTLLSGLMTTPTTLLSGLMTTPTTIRVLSTPDIISLVLRLSSVRVPSEAKKSGLMQLLQVPTVTESLVHQLLTMENGDLLCGVKCVLASYMDNETEDTAEVLELTLTFLNKCLALQKPSPRLRSLVVGKSKELAVSCGGMSVLEQLVVVSKTRGSNTAKVETMVCEEITEDLRSVPADRLLGCCYSSGDLQGEVASWVRMELEMDMQTAHSAFIRSIEEKYRVVELSLLRQDMTEVSLSEALLTKYPRSFWPAVQTVRQDQASPCVCLAVVQFLPTGHILAYTDMDWQDRLVMLDQELQFSQSVPLQTGARDLQPGHMVMVARADIQLSTSPLHQFTIARAIVLSLSPEQDTVRLYLLDHGMQASISTNKVSSLSLSLKTLSPRLVLCRVQGITPTPSTKLVAQSITTLSHLINSSTASTLVIRPSLSTTKILCQLLSSQQDNLIAPALDILYVLVSTQASLKHLVNPSNSISCISMELIIPSLLSMLSSGVDGLRTVCTALETIHCLLDRLQPDQLRKVFSDGKACSVLEKVEQVHTLGQYQAVLEKILDLDLGRRSKVSKEKLQSYQEEKSKLETKKTKIFNNTDIRERQLQPVYNPHRVVTMDRPVFASVEQLQHKQKVGTVSNTLTREQVVPVVHPDMERRKQERECLTADAMKIFQQHRGKLAGGEGGGGDTKVCDGSDGINDGITLGSGDVNVSKAANISAPVTNLAGTSAGASLPSWLGGDNSTSSSEDDDDSCLPPWLAKPVPHNSKPVTVSVSQLANSVAQLPFSSALASSTSSSQEDDDKIVSTKIPRRPTPTIAQASNSPEEFGSGTESGREVHMVKEQEQIIREVKMVKEQEQTTREVQMVKEQEQTIREVKMVKEQEQTTKEMQMVKEQQQQQTLIRDYILSEKHSIGVELWDTERKLELDKNQLAVLICGFLNTQAGGTIYAGVKRNGLVRGIPLERKDRDNLRQMLDRVLASMINPRVPPNIVDIDFVSVEDKSRPTCPYRLMVVMVKGQKEGLDKVYMAHNLTPRAHVEEGAYVRRGNGPAFNIKLGHQEMLRLVERR